MGYALLLQLSLTTQIAQKSSANGKDYRKETLSAMQRHHARRENAPL